MGSEMCIRDSYYVVRMLAGVNGRRDALYAKKTTVITPNPAHINISAGGVAKYATNKTEALIYLLIQQKKKSKFFQGDITTQIEVYIKNLRKKLALKFD